MKLVIYHWKRCSHCIRLFEGLQTEDPNWKKRIRSKIPLELVEYSKNMNRCSDDGIRSFPTIRLYKDNGEYDTYRGERTLKDLENFICDQTGRCGVPTLEGPPCRNGKSCRHHR